MANFGGTYSTRANVVHKMNTRHRLVFVAVLLLILWAPQVTVLNAQGNLTGDPVAGKTKAALCAACHGPEGVSVNPLWPNLAGQQEQYLVKQTKAFRDGIRTEITMDPFVKNLTDQDIADIAAYYAGLSLCP